MFLYHCEWITSSFEGSNQFHLILPSMVFSDQIFFQIFDIINTSIMYLKCLFCMGHVLNNNFKENKSYAR